MDLPSFVISLRRSLLSFCCWILCSLLLNSMAMAVTAATGFKTEGDRGEPGISIGEDAGIFSDGAPAAFLPWPSESRASAQSCDDVVSLPVLHQSMLLDADSNDHLRLLCQLLRGGTERFELRHVFREFQTLPNALTHKVPLTGP